MKKLLITIGIAALLAVSCVSSTAGTVYNDSVPPEQSSYITPTVGTVIGYNGITVHWKGMSNMIQIPAGDTLLEWDIDFTDGYIHYTGNGGLLTRYNFLPQKKYHFYVAMVDDKAGLRVYMYDYEEKIRPSMKDMETHYVNFIPFLNLAEKTVLE